MKVVVFGAGGMLGIDMMKALEREGFDAHGFASHEVNITDATQVLETLHIEKPDYVINCAAYTNVDEAEKDKETAMNVNGYALRNIAEACNQVGACLIHISTDYVFDGKKEGGYLEDDQTHPISAYGESKVLGEELVQQYCHCYAIIRTSWLYGKHGKNFVETMKNLFNEKDEIRVVNDQRGSPTYTVDLATMVVSLIQNNMLKSNGIFHLTNAGSATWFEFASEILKFTKGNCEIIPCTTDEFPRPAPRPKCSMLINTKLPALRSWKEALKEYLR